MPPSTSSITYHRDSFVWKYVSNCTRKGWPTARKSTSFSIADTVIRHKLDGDHFFTGAMAAGRFLLCQCDLAKCSFAQKSEYLENFFSATSISFFKSVDIKICRVWRFLGPLECPKCLLIMCQFLYVTDFKLPLSLCEGLILITDPPVCCLLAVLLGEIFLCSAAAVR